MRRDRKRLECWLIGLTYLLHGCTKLQQTATSPAGKVVADVLQSRSAAATDANATYIKLHDKEHPTPDSVLEGTYYDAAITISWADSKTLVVECDKCTTDETRLRENQWHSVVIQYRMQASAK